MKLYRIYLVATLICFISCKGQPQNGSDRDRNPVQPSLETSEEQRKEKLKNGVMLISEKSLKNSDYFKITKLHFPIKGQNSVFDIEKENPYKIEKFQNLVGDIGEIEYSNASLKGDVTKRISMFYGKKVERKREELFQYSRVDLSGSCQDCRFMSINYFLYTFPMDGDLDVESTLIILDSQTGKSHSKINLKGYDVQSTYTSNNKKYVSASYGIQWDEYGTRINTKNGILVLDGNNGNLLYQNSFEPTEYHLTLGNFINEDLVHFRLRTAEAEDGYIYIVNYVVDLKNKIEYYYQFNRELEWFPKEINSKGIIFTNYEKDIFIKEYKRDFIKRIFK